MKYQLTTKVPSIQDLIDLENATNTTAQSYLDLVEQQLDAELEVIRLNSADDEASTQATRVSSLRLFYDMKADAPADQVLIFHDRHDYDGGNEALLFPTWSDRRMKIEKAAEAKDLRDRSNGTEYVPEELFVETVNAARRAGLPLENLVLQFIAPEEAIQAIQSTKRAFLRDFAASLSSRFAS